MPWTVSQLVAQVDARTERRASQKIDLRIEFFLALDEFVNDQHFYWRKKRSSFQTVINSAVYDLALSAASGGSQPGGGITDFGQLDDMNLINPDGVSLAGEIVPITDPQAQLLAVLNNVADTPANGFIDTTVSLTAFRLGAPANVAQTIVYTYWAVPMVTDTSKDTIPLVPGHLHWGLIYALERRAYEFLYGQDDPRWQVANARYEEFLEAAANLPDWTARKVTEARAGSSGCIIVQSHV